MTQEPRPTPLLPCPFCGGKPRMTDDDWEHHAMAYVAYECERCGARSEVIEFPIMHNCGGGYRTPYEIAAMKKWNKRVLVASPKVLSGWEAIEKQRLFEDRLAESPPLDRATVDAMWKSSIIPESVANDSRTLTPEQVERARKLLTRTGPLWTDEIWIDAASKLLREVVGDE